MNPAKKIDASLVDLVVETKQGPVLGELKPMFTPFFLAGVLYGVDPRYAFSINKSDIHLYSRIDEKVLVLFWMCFEEQVKFEVRVKAVDCVWWMWMDKLVSYTHSKKLPVHTYLKAGPRDARDSYIIDVRDFHKVSCL